MPLINTNEPISQSRELDNIDERLKAHDEYLKKLREGYFDKAKKGTPKTSVGGALKASAIKIPEGFGLLEDIPSSAMDFRKQQLDLYSQINHFDENGQPVNIKDQQKKQDNPFSLLNLFSSESKKRVRLALDKKEGEINALELKLSINPIEFSAEDQKKLDEAYSDYDVYKMATDPVYTKARIDLLVEQNREIEAELGKFQRPDDYFGESDLPISPYADPIVKETDQLISFLKSRYAKSAASLYIIESNKTQAETSLGKISRAKELEDLGSLVDEFLNAAESLHNIDKELERYSRIDKLTPEQSKNRQQLLFLRTEAYRDYSRLKDSATKFSSWSSGSLTPIRYALSLIGKLLGASYKDTEELELDIPGKALFDALDKQLGKSPDPISGTSFERTLNRIRTNMKEFHAKNDQLRKEWRSEYEKDMQDIEDWKNGNNWLGAHASVDNYFKAQELLSHMNGMNPFSAQTILFANPGLMGASNSSWFKSIGGATAKLVGAAVSTFGTGGTALAVAGAAGAASLAADVSQGSDENNAEVYQAAMERFKSTLESKGATQDFLNEGFFKLLNDPKMQAFRKKFFELSDGNGLSSDTFTKGRDGSASERELVGDLADLRQEMNDYIIRQYFAEKWHSANPNVNKVHADAVVGVNGLYYNDVLSTTRDAVEDAIITCLPIKASAKAAKAAILGTDTGLKLGKTAQRVTNSIRTQIARAELLGKGIPGKIKRRATEIAIGSSNVVGGTIRGAEFVRSEMQEEAEQKLNTDDFRSGKFNSQLNTSIAERVIDDMSKGIPATWDYFIPGDTFGYASDQELMANQNGAILLSLPMALLTQSPRVVNNARKKISAYDTLWQIAQLKKNEDAGTIRQGLIYARHLSPEDKEMILSMFDKFAAANSETLKSQETDDSIRDNDSALPEEWINELRENYLNFYKHANNAATIRRADNTGISYGSEDYGTYVAIDYMYLDKLRDLKKELDNAAQSLADMQIDDQAYLWSDNDAEERSSDQILNLQQRDRALAGLAAAYQLKEEANAISESLGRSNYNKRTIDKNINLLKKNIKEQFDIDIESKDDLLQYVTDSETFEQLLEKSLEVQKHQQSFEMIKSQLDSFRSKPKNFIKKYNDAAKLDEALEQAIEEDYLNTIQEYDDADRREVLDNDVYIGNDGKTYITKVGEDGSIEKYLYDDKSRSAINEPLPFDKLEYHRAKVAQEKAEKDALDHEHRVNNAEDSVEQPETKPTQSADEMDKDEDDEDEQEPQKAKTKLPFNNSPNTVETEPVKRTTKVRSGKKENDAVRIYLPNNREKGYFEVVVDKNYDTDEPNGEYSVYFNPSEDEEFTDEEKKTLFDALSEMIPDGGIVSTYVTKENGISKKDRQDLDRLATEYGFKKTSEHPFKKNKTGKPLTRSWYTKKSKKKIEGFFYVKNPEEHETGTQKDSGKSVSKDEPKGNNKQQAVLEKLKQKTERDNKYLLRKGGEIVKTGHDYFFKFTNGIIRYVRVHGLAIMDSMFPEDNTVDIDNLTEELKDLRQSDPDAYKARILELQDEFNQSLEQQFGKDSIVYKFHKIDISVYTHDDLMNDMGVPEAVAQIVLRKIPNASVIAGTIIDEIARKVFAGQDVKYSSDYFMAEDTFEDLVQQLKERKQYYEETLGWVLDTTPHIWHCTLRNGQRVAGETDMIAVDRDGKIHILDFKTTKIELENVSQYKNPEYEEDEEAPEWVTITDNTVVPEGAEIRSFSNFILGVPKGAKRSYGQQYVRQLAAYSNIITIDDEFEVESILLVPIYTEKTYGEKGYEELQSIDLAQVGNLIDLTKMSELQEDINKVNSYLNTSTVEPYTKKSIEKSKLILKDFKEKLGSWKKSKIKDDTKKLIDKLLADIDKYDKQLDALLKDKSKMKETATVVEFDKKASRIKNRLDDIERLVAQEDEEAIKNSNDRRDRLEKPDNTYTPLFDDAPEGKEDYGFVPDEGDMEDADYSDDSNDNDYNNDVDEDVELSDKRWQYNSLAGLHGINRESVLSLIKNLFKRVLKKDAASVQPDFITLAKFVVYKDGLWYKVDVEYGGKTYKGLLLNIGRERMSKKMSKRGKQLVKQYKSLKELLEKGQRIIATDVSRTNGTIITGKDRPLEGSMFLSKFTQEFADSLINGENSLLGLADEERIYALQEDSNKGVRPPIYVRLRDNNDGQITSGSIVYLYKFKYDEDPADSAPRVIPVVLRPKFLTDNDADTVIRILQNGVSSLDDDFEATVKTKSGTHKKKIKGLTNRSVLNLLSRFGGLAELEGNEFKFDFKRDEFRKVVKGGRVVVITDMRDDLSRKRKTVEINLDNSEDIKKLKSILKKVTLHCQQEGNLRHNLNSHADTYTQNPYSFATAFFENESNGADIDSSIEISESIVIDARDVYSSDDMSRGLSGAAWMIKHGMVQCNIYGLEDPIISINSLGIEGLPVVNKPKKEKKVLKKEKPEIEKQPTQEPVVLSAEEQEPLTAEQPNEDVTEEELKNKQDIDRIKKLLATSGKFKGGNLAPGARKGGVRHKVVSQLGTVKRNKEDIVKRLYSIFGKYMPDIKWFEGVVDITAEGYAVGRIVPDAMHLSLLSEEGVEYHEAFHRILDILIPVKVLEKILKRYKERHGEQFKQENGREMDESDVSEALADQFMEFRRGNIITKDNGILNMFKQMWSYVKALAALKDWQLAALYVAVNTGLFKHIKPNKASIERFKKVAGGLRNMQIRNEKTGQLEQFDQFSDYSGRKLYDAAIEGLTYALLTGQNITEYNQVEQLDDSLDAIKHLTFTEEEDLDKKDMSSWFKVVSGSYIFDNVEFTMEDAVTFQAMYEGTPVMDDILLEVSKKIGEKATSDEALLAVINTIIEQESKKKSVNELLANQRMMHEMLKHPDVMRQQIKKKLAKLLIQSKKVINQDNNDGIETESWMGDEYSVHDYREFYKHARSETASAQVVFFLSTIPSNETNLLGYPTFVPFKTVSNKLLQRCHKCRTAKELDERLKELGKTDHMFSEIYERFHKYYERQIIRHESSEDGVLGKPKVYTRTITKDGKAVDFKMLSEDSYNIKTDENGKYIAVDTNGTPIENAQFLIDYSSESIVTQIWQYTRCQRLDFTYLSIEAEDSADGGKDLFKMSIKSTDSDYASTVYPRDWFNRLKNPNFGIFKAIRKETKDGQDSEIKYIFAKHGKNRLLGAISNIRAIRAALLKGDPKVTLVIEQQEGVFEKLKYSTVNDFDVIESEFVSALNNLGISIDKDVFEECICEYFGTADVQLAMSNLMQTKSLNISLAAFVKDLRSFEKKIENGEASSVLTVDKKASEGKTRSNENYVAATGVYMYSESAFVKALATAYSRHQRMTKELMTLGPNRTKRYTMAQCHTVSDITDTIANANYDETTREISGSDLVKDLAQYAYNIFYKKNPITGKTIAIGSRMIKGVFEGSNKNLVLHTFGGVKTQDSKTGGKDYTEIAEREDYLAKMEILRQGGIIFPTLSDKATWFYLTGCRLAGLDYDHLKASEIADITTNDGQLTLEYADYTQNIEVLDLLLEYARCEHEMIRRELERSKHLSIMQKIQNYFTKTNNAVRYGTMTEYYEFTEVEVESKDGSIHTEYKARPVYLSDYDASPEECFKRAEKFFGPETSEADRRRSMMMCLQKITEQNLDKLVEYGLIEKSGNKSLSGYSNIGLNSDVINKLKELILKRNNAAKRYKNKTAKERDRIAESQAIVAYVTDICGKSILSCEETERLYTGMPHGFKWKHGKLYDPITRRTIDALYDRYDDEVKRHGGAGSTGDQNRLDLLNIAEEYTCAECIDPEISSELSFAYRQGFIDNEFREALFNLEKDSFKTSEELESFTDELYGENRISVDEIKKRIREKFPQNSSLTDAQTGRVLTVGEVAVKEIQDNIESEIDKYVSEGIAVADGAAYIRPSMAKTLLRQRGALTEKVELAFSILDGTYEEKRDKLGMFASYSKSNISSKNPLSNQKAYKIVTDALMGSQKYSAYGYRMMPSTEEDKQKGIGSMPIHYYNKFALFPLFPQMATGTSKDLLLKMEQDGVDMMMMNDAVKVGGCGALTFDVTDSDPKKALEKFDNFSFNIYKQKFTFIRRQMNTNPKEELERAVGTQMLKVSLGAINKSLKYVDADGKTVRGWLILNRINENLNNLSDVGERYFRSKFFNNGKFDVEQFSNFLHDQLDSRNADANLLNGIEIITDPETGEKRMRLPLEAMSSSEWLLSIINSAINAEVIDVVTEGNAYYQRSAYQVEGTPIKAKLDDGMTLYDGKTLKAINEDGSMDAVISIDYFIHLVPENIRNDFFKARQWLIDQNIIGANAHANTIGYRIPTQAQSSIHPLRFVDVLPVVRDTIILPKDFTAITGSDFDIDKIYLSSLYYKKIYKDVLYTDKDGNTKTRRVQTGVTTNIDKPEQLSEEDYRKRSDAYVSTKKYYLNNLMKDYLTVLKDRGRVSKVEVVGKDGKKRTEYKYTPSNSIHTLYRPVDKDTGLVDDFIDELERDTPKKRWISWLAGSLAYQVAKKMEFMVGKIGIGPFALNNSSHILSWIYGLKFKKENSYMKDGEQVTVPTILECLKASSLANKLSKCSNSIFSWLSGLINIHVDVAKNPKPKKLNINSFTWNITALLTRVGLDFNALAFVRQPIMVQYAAINERCNGEFMADPGKSVYTVVRELMDEWVKDQFVKGTEKDKLDTINKIDGWSDGTNAEGEYRVGLVLKQLMGVGEDGLFTNKFTIAKLKEGEIEVNYANTEEGVENYDYITVDGNSVRSKIKSRRQTSILKDILINKDARIDPNKPATFDNLKDDDSFKYVITIDGIEQMLTPKEVQMYVYFAYKQLEKYANAMSDVVNTTKIDTKKQGSSIIEQQSYLDSLKSVLDPDTTLFESDGLYAMYGMTYNADKEVDSEWDKFEKYESTSDSITHDHEIQSFVGHKTINAMRLYSDVMQHMTIQAQPSFIDAHRRLMSMIGGSLKDTKKCKKVASAMMQYLKSCYMSDWMQQEGMTVKDILLGQNSVQDLLISIQNILRRDKSGKYWQYEDNKLLKALVPDIYAEEKGEENYKFIKLDNSFLDEQDDANDIEQAWDELLSDDVTEFQIRDSIITPKMFAERLVAYAFITSADTTGMTKFFKYVPNSWREQQHGELGSYADYMYNIQNYGYVFTEEELEEIIRNNWQDRDFVREVSRKKGTVQKISGKDGIDLTIACIRKIKDKLTKKEIFQSSVTKLNTNGQFPMFIRRRRPGAKNYQSDSYLLYKLVYVGTKTVGKNTIEYPIYSLTYPKGKQYRAGSYTYDIKQYADSSVLQQAYKSAYNTFGNTVTQEDIAQLALYINDAPADGVDLQSISENISPAFSKPASIRKAISILSLTSDIDEELFDAVSKAIDAMVKQKKQAKEEKVENEKNENKLDNKLVIGSKENPIQIYSDGSDIKGTGQIGYGAVFMYEGKAYGLSGTEASAEVTKLREMFPDAKFSNPTMEMLALTTTLEHFANSGIGEHIEINQDYKGAVNFGELWKYSEGSEQREAKAWKPKEEYISHLVDRAVSAINKIIENGGSVKIKWVKGHLASGTEQAKMNDLADSYAKSRDEYNNMLDVYNNINSSNKLSADKEEYTPLFDDAPEGAIDDEFNDPEEYPEDAKNTCKKGGNS